MGNNRKSNDQDTGNSSGVVKGVAIADVCALDCVGAVCSGGIGSAIFGAVAALVGKVVTCDNGKDDQ